MILRLCVEIYFAFQALSFPDIIFALYLRKILEYPSADSERTRLSFKNGGEVPRKNGTEIFVS